MYLETVTKEERRDVPELAREKKQRKLSGQVVAYTRHDHHTYELTSEVNCSCSVDQVVKYAHEKHEPAMSKLLID
jgi:hypothetical protein